MSGLEQPKKPAGGGFGRFVAEKRPEFQAKCAGKPVSEVSKLAGQEWGKLSEAQQAPYKKLFVEAQAKYKADMAAFLAAGGEAQKGAAAKRKEKRLAKEGKATKQKDPNAPKKPVGGAYGCFLTANRAAFQKLCPGSVTGVGKLAGEKWKAASAAEKEKYEKEYKAKAEAYKEAMKSYVPPAAVEKDDKDDDVEETPAKKAKTTQEDKASKKEDKKAAKEDKKAAKEAAKEEKKAAKDEKKEEKKAAAVSKKTTKTVGKKGVVAQTMLVEIPQTVLAKADKAGMTETLKKLLSRDDVKAAKISPSAALSALEGAGGLLHKARRELLGE